MNVAALADTQNLAIGYDVTSARGPDIFPVETAG